MTGRGRRPGGVGAAPWGAVIVPCRDEELSLPGLLESLRRHAPGIRVVVVDDDSADRTAELARAAGVEVVTPGPPPPGWTGKAWACHVGERHVGGDPGELLAFLDADVRLGPRAQGWLAGLHAGAGEGLVSVLPHHLPERAYEQLSTYFCVVSAMAAGVIGVVGAFGVGGGSGAGAGAGVFGVGAGTRGAGRPMAFGPCLVTTRGDLDAAGGHAAVRGEVLDDVALAAAYARAGLPTVCVVGGSEVSMRSYPGGPAQLVAGWRKNMASGAGATAPSRAAATAAWVAGQHAAVLGVAVAAVWPRGTRGRRPVGAVALAGYALAAGLLRGRLRRVGEFAPWAWLAFPIPLVFFDAVLALSAVDTVVRRRVRWRGRVVEVG